VAWPVHRGFADRFGLFAWWLFRHQPRDARSERAVVSRDAGGRVYGIVLPSLTPVFSDIEVSRALRTSVASDQRRRPPAIMTDPRIPGFTQTLLTAFRCAADFHVDREAPLCADRQRSSAASCTRRWRSGWRYIFGARNRDGYNFSQDARISISIFRSEGNDKMGGPDRSPRLAQASPPQMLTLPGLHAQLVRTPSHSRRAKLRENWRDIPVAECAGAGLIIVRWCAFDRT